MTNTSCLKAAFALCKHAKERMPTKTLPDQSHRMIDCRYCRPICDSRNCDNSRMLRTSEARALLDPIQYARPEYVLATGGVDNCGDQAI